jgi:polyketide biosynthesis acyl carrier protein
MATMTWAKIFELVKANIYEVLPDVEGREIEPGDRLVDLGANSVDRAEIVMLIMEALSLRVARAELARASDIGQLVEALHAKCAEL